MYLSIQTDSDVSTYFECECLLNVLEQDNALVLAAVDTGKEGKSCSTVDSSLGDYTSI